MQGEEADDVSPWGGRRRRLLLAVPREGRLLVVAHAGRLVVVVVVAVATGAVGRCGVTVATSALVGRRRAVSSWGGGG